MTNKIYNRFNAGQKFWIHVGTEINFIDFHSTVLCGGKGMLDTVKIRNYLTGYHTVNKRYINYVLVKNFVLFPSISTNC